mgnify:CR=1 FL=1
MGKKLQNIVTKEKSYQGLDYKALDSLIISLKKYSNEEFLEKIMNPKLTPFSQSGVELPWGQKVLLKTPGKDLLLLTVSDTIRKGARIDVADLIDAALNPSDK